MKKLSIVIIIAFSFVSIKSQPRNNQINDVTLPSPEATALGIYTDIPVDHSTGIPSVSIPIYNFGIGTLQLPISLSYHAGGIRLRETSSWVGTNWSINYGGHISRTIQGKADESANGYLSIGSSIALTNNDTCVTSIPAGNSTLYLGANGSIDLERDIFTYNAGSYSGKFYIKDDGTAVTIPKSDVKISYVLGPSISDPKRIQKIKILTPDGIIYEYGNDVSNNEVIEVTEFNDNTFWTATGWYLKRITSSDSKYFINFTYINEEYSFKNWSPKGTYILGGYSLNKSDVIGYRLDKIESNISNQTIISFIANDIRLDLDNTVINKETKKLSKIKIEDGSSFCKEFVFNSNYLTDNSSNKSYSSADNRLFLDDIQEVSCDGSVSNPKYILEYIKDSTTPAYFPTRHSTAIDHWGYFNGVVSNPKSSSNMPYSKAYYDLGGGPVYIHFGNSNRETVESKMMLGSLKKITYPTGGSHEYIMEANTIFDPVGVYSSQTLATLQGEQCMTNFLAGTYNVTFSDLTNITYKWDKWAFQGWACCNTSHSLVKITNLNNMGEYVVTTSTNCNQGSTNPTQSGFLKDLFPQLQVGIPYKIEFFITNTGAKFILENHTIVGINQNKDVGGLRVYKKIANDAMSVSNNIISTYKYHNAGDMSNAVMVSKPIYSLSHIVKFYTICGATSTGNVTHAYFIEDGIVPLSSFEGKYLYYKSVVEYYEDNFGLGNGATVYNFTEEIPPTIGFPAVIQPTVNAGNQLFIENYDNTNTNLISSQANTVNNDIYVEDNYLSIKTFWTNNNGSPGQNWYPYKPYRIRNKPYRLASTTKILDNVSTNQTYTYDPTNRFNMPISESVTNSDGKVHKTEYTYIHDYTDTAIKNDMLNRNIIGSPFKSIKKVDNIVVDGSENEYAWFKLSDGTYQVGSSGAFPRLYKKYRYEYTFNILGTITGTGKTIQSTINSYESNGFPYTVTIDGWQPISYEWFSNGLMKKTTFQNHIKEYTYYSGTRLLNTFKDIDGQIKTFEFDKLSRLNKVRERANNVITDITYHFKESTGDTYNWMKTKKTFTATTNSSLTTLETKEVVDGLGRPIQVIKINYSPNNKDVVIGKEYDNKGRLIKEYQPIESTFNNGTVIAIPGATPHTLTAYFQNPLNRPSSITPPGWTYPTTYSYEANAATDVANLLAGGNYTQNLFNKTIITNGDGNRVISFKDKLGREVLNWITNTSYSSHAKTYTIYDDKSRIKTIVPPGATLNTTPDLIFTYTYDQSDNILSKKVPDKNVENMIYNNRDLLAFSQDGNQLAINKWIHNQYDDYGRILKSGYIDMTMPSIPLGTNNYTYTDLFTENSYYTLIADGVKLGKPKQNKSKILGTSDTWIEQNFDYDTYGRVSTITGTNYLYNNNSAETTTMTYDFADNVMTENRVHKQDATPANNSTINKRWTYDISDRNVDHFITLNGGTEQKISNQNYTIKDELKEKNLGAVSVSGVNSYLQSLDYSYNDQGWLRTINQTTLSATNSALPTTVCSPTIPNQATYNYAANPDPNDLFYLELKYDGTGYSATGLPTNIQKGGNIAQAIYRVRGRDLQVYNYSYDYLNRMLNSTHYTINASNVATASNLYNENLTYNDRGNISSLIRQGYYTFSTTCAYNTIDNLAYVYTANTNKLLTVTDNAGANFKTRGFNPGSGGAGYTYDANGNLKSDSYKGITNITYNYLNLPITISWGTTKSIEFVYSAAGEKLQKKVLTGVTVNSIQHYIGGIEYNSASGTNRRVESIFHSEGRFFNTNTGTTTPTYRTEYTIKDHLGNARVTFADLNANGKIDVTNSTSTNEIIQENHYYAFGMAQEGPWLMNNSAKDNFYMYNSKEYNNDHALNWSDYGARWYDAAIGRWGSVDPLAEKFFSFSPYNYVLNNPLKFIDPDGMDVWDDVFRLQGEVRQNQLSADTQKANENNEAIANNHNNNQKSTSSSTSSQDGGDCDCGCLGKPPCPTDGSSIWGSFIYAWESMIYIFKETGSKLDEEFTNGQIQEGNYVYAAAPILLGRIKVPYVSGWVQKKIFRGLEKVAKERVQTAIAKGIVGPTAENGIIKLTASEVKQLGGKYTHKIKINADMRIYGKINDNNHILFDYLNGHKKK